MGALRRHPCGWAIKLPRKLSSTNLLKVVLLIIVGFCPVRMTKNSCASSKECAAAKSLASPAAEARRRRHLQRGEAQAGLSRLSLRIYDLGEVQQLLSLHEQQQQHVRHRQRQRRLPPAVAGDVQQRLAESGVVILPSLVDVKLCEAMAAEVHTRVMAAAIDTYDVKGHWLRKDLGPSLIGDGMYPTILGALSTLFADVLEGILGTDPELYEYVCTASVCCLDHTVLIHIANRNHFAKVGDFSFFCSFALIFILTTVCATVLLVRTALSKVLDDGVLSRCCMPRSTL